MHQRSAAAGATLSPLLLRNLITTADISLLSLPRKPRPLQLLRRLISFIVLFIIRLITFLPNQLLSSTKTRRHQHPVDPQKPPDANLITVTNRLEPDGDSAIARALSQLLSIVNEIPVSSMKYEVVRSLAERIIEENLKEGSEALREVNCCVLSAAFSRTLSQLEALVAEQQEPLGFGGGVSRGGGLGFASSGWVWRRVLYLGDVARSKVGGWGVEERLEAEQEGGRSAVKKAAELLWFAQKLVDCGGVEGAVEGWASASSLSWLALSAEPRLQGSLVKASAFLIKQAKDIGQEERADRERKIQIQMKLLVSWLPLLCRANNGTDVPTLSSREREEVERVLEEMIEMLERQEDREKVLSLWLHHFTACPSSDWPNLLGCYARWCTASRKLVLTQ